ncbi:MAG: response regulator transcription factor [Lachnospiraceae bacterium]|nr:response regulator transcription factor [Lachnospiraceae bacterium]
MRVLIAEDEKSLSNALVKILEKSKYTVDAVYDGLSALDYLELSDYDACVMDIMMPEMDGITALKEYRAKGGKTPIILLTAKSEIDDKVDGLDAGANDYLTKPFDPKELLARIRVMTRADSAPQPEPVIVLGNVTLNRKTFELSVENEKILLNNKEFQILEYLMMNSKQIISADMLFERVWGEDSESDINSVWVYISTLRKKMKGMGSNVTIKAIRNSGYTLVVGQ